MAKLRITLDNLKKELDSLTLKELSSRPELQRELSELLVLINDYLKLMNPWNRSLDLKLKNNKNVAQK